MRLTVSSAMPGMNWNAKGDERLAQNVANLIRLYQSEIPFYREMGVDNTFLHQPLPDAEPELQDQIEEMLEGYAKGVTVEEVRVFTDEATGRTVIEVDLSDEEDEEGGEY